MRELAIKRILEIQTELKAVHEEIFGKGSYNVDWYTPDELKEMSDEELLLAFANIFIENA